MAGRSLDGGILMTMHRFSQGGADRVGVLLANGFARAGIPTRIAVLRGGGEGERALLDLADPDVSIRYAGAAMGSRHLELVRGLRFIEREIASARPSVVLASSNNMGLVTGLSARLQRNRGPRYAMKVTNPVVRPRDSGTLRTLYRHRLYDFVFRPYARILTLTEAERHTLSRLYPAQADRFETTINPYVTPAMLADFAPRGASGGAHILTLARMMPQKRLDLLLAAFARVGDTRTRLTVIGDGPERAKLERLACSLGIASRVAMPGFVRDVVPWLRRSDLFALTSDYEGLPAAVLEALACNVPVITTDCFDGVRDLLVGAERCAVVPRGDVTAVARAIDASLAAERPAEGLRAIARRYTVDSSIRAHIDALAPLIARRGRPALLRREAG